MMEGCSGNCIQIVERKEFPTTNSVPGKIIFSNWGKIKTFGFKGSDAVLSIYHTSGEFIYYEFNNPK